MVDKLVHIIEVIVVILGIASLVSFVVVLIWWFVELKIDDNENINSNIKRSKK
jgi:hypothetical protein